MKPTEADILQAISSMSMMRFFPPGELAVTILAALLGRMVGTREQLNWLTETLVNNVSEWPGPAQLRALFCTQFPPADGIDGPPCEITGYTPADGERKYLEREATRGYLPSGDSPRLLTGEVEPVSESSDLQILVEGLAKQKSMSSTPMTRINERKRVAEVLK